MEEKQDGVLEVSFPEVHRDAKCSIVLQRTLRVPEEAKCYPVPPGKGRFSLSRLSSGTSSPPLWRDGDESVLLPMYQGDALSIIFVGTYPMAVKVAAGGRNAFNGKKLHDSRFWRPQDFTVIPGNLWKEWYCVGNGRPRQFVARPIRRGAFRSLSSDEEYQDIRITAYPMKPAVFREFRKKKAAFLRAGNYLAGISGRRAAQGQDDGREECGRSAWEHSSTYSAQICPVNSPQYMDITGGAPPGRAPTETEYSDAGLPWHDAYGDDRAILGRHVKV